MYKKPVKVKQDEAEVKLNDRYSDDHPLENVPKAGPHDVLYGRGGGTNHHAGNKKFRELIDHYKPQYLQAKRLDKPGIAMTVVTKWRMQDPPGRFLKSIPGDLWSDVGDAKAREKTSQALREKAAVLRQCLGYDGKTEFAKSNNQSSNACSADKSTSRKTVSLALPLPTASTGLNRPVAAKRHTSNEIEPVKSSKLGKKPTKLSFRDHSLALNHLPGASTRTSARKVFDGPAGGAFEELSEVECLDAIFDDDSRSSDSRTATILATSSAGCSLDHTENLLSQSTSPPTETSLNGGDVVAGALGAEFPFSSLGDVLRYSPSASVEKKQPDKNVEGNLGGKRISSDIFNMKPPLARPLSVKIQGREFSTSSKDTFPPRSALTPIPRPNMLQINDRDVSACTIASELSGDFSALKLDDVDDLDLDKEFGDSTDELGKASEQRQPSASAEAKNDDGHRKRSPEPLHEPLKPEAKPAAKRDIEEDMNVSAHEQHNHVRHNQQRYGDGRLSEHPPSYYDDGNCADLYMPPSRLLPPMHRDTSMNTRAYESAMLNDRCTSMGTFDGRHHRSTSGRSISSGSTAAAYERALLGERASSLGTFVPPNVARSGSMLSSSNATLESGQMLRRMLSEQARNGFDQSTEFTPSSSYPPHGMYESSFSRSNSYGIPSYPSSYMSSGRRNSGGYYDDQFIPSRETVGQNRYYDYDNPHLDPMPRNRFFYGSHPPDRQESTSSWKSYPTTYESQADHIGLAKKS